MALRWDLSAVKDADDVCWMDAPEDMPMHGVKKGDRIMNPVTNTLIWTTIAVDLPGITKENAPEFFARVRFLEKYQGPFMYRAEVDGKRPEGSACFITEDEVISHIGLTCNVSPLGRAAWLKKFTVDLDRDEKRVKAMIAEALAA